MSSASTKSISYGKLLSLNMSATFEMSFIWIPGTFEEAPSSQLRRKRLKILKSLVANCRCHANVKHVLKISRGCCFRKVSFFSRKWDSLRCGFFKSGSGNTKSLQPLDISLIYETKTVPFVRLNNFQIVLVFSFRQWSTKTKCYKFSCKLTISTCIHTGLDVSITVLFSCA